MGCGPVRVADERAQPKAKAKAGESAQPPGHETSGVLVPLVYLVVPVVAVVRVVREHGAEPGQLTAVFIQLPGVRRPPAERT